MSLTSFLEDPASFMSEGEDKKRKAVSFAPPPVPQKAAKSEGEPNFTTPYDCGPSTFRVGTHRGGGYTQVEHCIAGSPYPFCSAAVVSSANTLRALSAREFDNQMKVHFRAADHPKLNEERTQKMHAFIEWIHTTADQMLDFVWENREALAQNWRDKSLRKSIDRAMKGNEKDEAKAKLKWLDSEKLFRSYKQEWEQTGPSVCASRSFDAWGTTKQEGENEIHLFKRENRAWTKIGGKCKGPDVEGSAGHWEGMTYIPKGSVIMLRLRFQFFSSAVGYGVSLKFGKDIAILADSVATRIQADVDL